MREGYPWGPAIVHKNFQNISQNFKDIPGAAPHSFRSVFTRLAVSRRKYTTTIKNLDGSGVRLPKYTTEETVMCMSQLSESNSVKGVATDAIQTGE